LKFHESKALIKRLFLHFREKKAVKYFYEDGKQLISVMAPILIAQISMIGMNFLDTAMAGHAGPEDLAGVSVGANLFMPMITSINGVLMAATPILAQLLGRGEKGRISEVVRTGMMLGLLMAGLMTGGYFLAADYIMGGLGLEPEVERIADGYLLAVTAGTFFAFPMMPLRALADTAVGTSVSMKLYLSALPINAALNYFLIFGHGGFPRLGGIGAGVATALTYIILLCFFVTFTLHSPFLEGKKLFSSFSVRKDDWKEYLGIGIPNGLGIFMETSLFGFIILFIAPFGTDILAAHQAAMNYSGLIYMLPLSFSMALTILVGMEAGAGHYRQAHRMSHTGMKMAVFCGMAAAFATITGRFEIARIYTGETHLMEIITLFLSYTAAWQIFDGIACPIQGILRGYKDVKIPFYMSMTAYWGICLPSGIWLEHITAEGPFAYWQGLVIGVGFSALLMGIRLHQVEKSQNKRCVSVSSD
jgi:MATE family multidrug resistance protein